MKAGLFVCVVVGVMVTLSVAETTIEDLQGEYMGQISFPTIIALNAEGNFTNYCLSEFSEACLAEVPEGVMRVVVQNESISFSFVRSVGINTPEKSFEAYPSCVAGGIFPIETVIPLPLAPIQSYDPSTGHLTFIDARRPDNLNCAIVTLEENKGTVPSISAKYILSVEGVPELEALALGPNFRCLAYNDLCIAETTINGDFVSLVDLDFEVPCVSGACMGSQDK